MANFILPCDPNDLTTSMQTIVGERQRLAKATTT